MATTEEVQDRFQMAFHDRPSVMQFLCSPPDQLSSQVLVSMDSVRHLLNQFRSSVTKYGENKFIMSRITMSLNSH